jgi:tRNA G10  N-methylase Trm11
LLGTHQGYLESTKILEERRTQKIWLAEQWRQYQLQCINIAFESEKKQAEDEFQNEKKELKEKLIKSILKKRKQLEEEKNTMSLVDGPEIRVSTRTLRKRGKDAKSDKEKQNGQFKRPPCMSHTTQNITHTITHLSLVLFFLYLSVCLIQQDMTFMTLLSNHQTLNSDTI